MADGAVNFLLDKLTTTLLLEASLLGDAHEEIEEIKLEVESMRSCLRDAERRKQTVEESSESVSTWVRQVREVSYEAEDVIDEFIYHKDGMGHRKGYKGFVRYIINLPKTLTTRHRISVKLRKIKAKVHEISERRKKYGFDHIIEERTRNVASDGWQHNRESSVFVDEDEVVGMEENTEKLLKWLTDDEPRRMAMTIVGMGGLGKTTLVSKVYNNQTIKRHFDCWVWISVSQAYGVGELLRSMISELLEMKQVVVPSNVGSMNYMQLMGVLIENLRHKRYVVVLDDVWSIDLWSKIRAAFPNNKHGSRIILTTRNENVAASVGVAFRVHRLEPLQEEDAWILFCKKAFWNEPDRTCPRELQPLARAIMNKCEGLPLAIVAIGGLTCLKNKTVADWKKVYESLNWQFSNHPMLERVRGILLLSFNDLPFYLKHCFLYCCVFRDGYSIKRKKLIRLWVAEGFIIERKGMTMEEVAEDYLTELIFRNMVQVTETNDAGRVKTCRVHDVMRELAMTTAEKENFCTTYIDSQLKLEGKIHRLSVYNTGETIRLSRTMSRHLRSFFVFETNMCSTLSLNALSLKFKLLRVLDLEGVLIESVPDALVGLFNLRYLNLKETKVRELPKAMERLTNLQTLDIRNTNVKKLPSGILKLQKLRHLYMYCNNDQSNYRCSMRVPKGIWNIRSLQTLACIEAEEELIQQVGNLTELRRLEITMLKAADGSKLCTSLQMMKNILHLGVVAIRGEELELEALSLPPLYLQKLKLVGKLKRLPHWFSSLTNLTHLYLGLSQLQDDVLSPLHVLSTLVFLELNKAFNGKFLHFRAEWFPKLHKLNLLELEQLDSVRLDENALPSIRELYLIRCQKLEVLPQGIEHLTGLQKLYLEEMPKKLVEAVRSDLSEDKATVRHISTINYVYLSEQTRVTETLC